MKKTITLTDGTKVAIAAVPPQVYDDVMAAFPDPQPPVRETETAAGEKLRWYDDKDPAYQAAEEETERRRAAALQDQILLWGLPDVEVPDNDAWLAPIAMSKRALLGEPWQPPGDEIGRRLLYIKYVLLRSAADALRVRQAINELSGVSEERVAQIKESFQRPVEGTTD